MAGRVETAGELTRGVTVFDRRLRPQWKVNMQVARDVSVAEAREQLHRSLRFAGQQST
jgi:purine nucleosidase